MNKQEKKQAEELANAGGVELSDDDTAKASGGALLEDYVPNADAYIRCPFCNGLDLDNLDGGWHPIYNYKCRSCKKSFEYNVNTKEHKQIKSGGCS